MSNSPNSLEIRPKVNAVLGSKKIFYAVIGLGIFTVIMVIFGISTAGKKSNKEQEEKSVPIQIEDIKSFAPESPDGGLLAPKIEEKPVEAQVIADKDIPIPEIKISRMPDPSETTKRFIQMREQRLLEAINAPSQAYVNSTTVSAAMSMSQQTNQPLTAQQQNNTLEGLINSSVSLNGENTYNVAADIDKENFFERSKPDNQWINPNIRTAGQKYEIKTGSVIPAAMVTAINSDLPGNMIAQVTQNIYDSATGGYLLIPQGSKLFGVYDSRVIMGQRRVLVAWNRIIFPDGSAMTIPGVPGADMAGNSGFSQKVDNHYFRIFGSSILMALITAGTAYAVDENTKNDNENSLSSQLNSALAQQLGQVTTSLLEKHLNIKPTLEIEPGYQFNIVLTKDLVFGGSYKGWK